jgi:hypothetical protein
MGKLLVLLIICVLMTEDIALRKDKKDMDGREAFILKTPIAVKAAVMEVKTNLRVWKNLMKLIWTAFQILDLIFRGISDEE